jgi:molybdenum cofactor guanylyltransferase
MIFTTPLADKTKSSSDNFNSNCLGIVLAGGLSSRMGQDKSQLSRNDIKMLDYSKRLLIDVGIKNIVVSGAFEAQNANTFATDIFVPDIIKQGGPVAGIYSVLQRFQPKAIFILPVDLPLMTPEVLQQLKTTGELSKKACFFQTRDGAHNIPLYLPNNAYLALFLADAFKQTGSSKIATNNTGPNKKGPSMKSLLKQVPHESIVAPNTKTFNDALFNTNTPEQWQIASKKFS